MQPSSSLTMLSRCGSYLQPAGVSAWHMYCGLDCLCEPVAPRYSLSQAEHQEAPGLGAPGVGGARQGEGNHLSAHLATREHPRMEPPDMEAVYLKLPEATDQKWEGLGWSWHETRCWPRTGKPQPELPFPFCQPLRQQGPLGRRRRRRPTGSCSLQGKRAGLWRR